MLMKKQKLQMTALACSLRPPRRVGRCVVHPGETSKSESNAFQISLSRSTIQQYLGVPYPTRYVPVPCLGGLRSVVCQEFHGQVFGWSDLSQSQHSMRLEHWMSAIKITSIDRVNETKAITVRFYSMPIQDGNSGAS
jgi:hypothetical protein